MNANVQLVWRPGLLYKMERLRWSEWPITYSAKSTAAGCTDFRVYVKCPARHRTPRSPCFWRHISWETLTLGHPWKEHQTWKPEVWDFKGYTITLLLKIGQTMVSSFIGMFCFGYKYKFFNELSTFKSQISGIKNLSFECFVSVYQIWQHGACPEGWLSRRVQFATVPPQARLSVRCLALSDILGTQPWSNRWPGNHSHSRSQACCHKVSSRGRSKRQVPCTTATILRPVQGSTLSRCNLLCCLSFRELDEPTDRGRHLCRMPPPSRTQETAFRRETVYQESSFNYTTKAQQELMGSTLGEMDLLAQVSRWWPPGTCWRTVRLWQGPEAKVSWWVTDAGPGDGGRG